MTHYPFAADPHRGRRRTAPDWRAPVTRVADPQIALAAIATATERVRLGPMVTPLARRRPVKVARETATLDVLSGGRLTLGVGLGSDEFGREYSRTGDAVDDRKRAQMLDESLEILRAAWSGETVHHRGEHYVVDGVRFLPRPLHDRPAEPYDMVAVLPPGRDPEPYRAAGATWWLVEFPREAPSADQVRATIRERPAPRQPAATAQ